MPTPTPPPLPHLFEELTVRSAKTKRCINCFPTMTLHDLCSLLASLGWICITCHSHAVATGQCAQFRCHIFCVALSRIPPPPPLHTERPSTTPQGLAPPPLRITLTCVMGCDLVRGSRPLTTYPLSTSALQRNALGTRLGGQHPTPLPPIRTTLPELVTSHHHPPFPQCIHTPVASAAPCLKN